MLEKFLIKDVSSVSFEFYRSAILGFFFVIIFKIYNVIVFFFL